MTAKKDVKYRERVKALKEKQNPLKDDIKDLLHNRPWWILLGAGVAALVFNSIRDGATVYYFKYYVVEEDLGEIMFFGLPFVMSGLYLPLAMVHVCRLRRLFGTEDRQPCHRPYLLVLVHEPEVRVGHR